MRINDSLCSHSEYKRVCGHYSDGNCKSRDACQKIIKEYMNNSKSIQNYFETQMFCSKWELKDTYNKELIRARAIRDLQSCGILDSMGEIVEVYKDILSWKDKN